MNNKKQKTKKFNFKKSIDEKFKKLVEEDNVEIAKHKKLEELAAMRLYRMIFG